MEKEFQISNDLKLIIICDQVGICTGVWLNDILLDNFEVEKLRMLIDNRNNLMPF